MTNKSIRALGRALTKYYEAASKKHHGNKHTWMAHLEGRHGRRSGMWFVKALCTEVGAKGFVQTVDKLERVVGNVLESAQHGQQRACLDHQSVETLLQAAEGKLVLAVETGGAAEHAGPYNAVDIARWMIIWLVSTKRMDVPELSPDNYALVIRGMSQECQFSLSEAGVESADLLQKKAEVLDRLAVPSTRPPPTFVFTRVIWPCVLIHLCEVAQVERDIPAQDLQRVFSSIPRVIAGVIHTRTVALQSEERHSIGCHAVLVTRAAIAACNETYEDIARRDVTGGPGPRKDHDPPRILKRPAECSDRARSQVLKKPAFMMICPRCGSEVRNDVISRHMATPKCKREALQVNHVRLLAAGTSLPVAADAGHPVVAAADAGHPVVAADAGHPVRAGS